jgi:hypothetical protein
MPVEAKPLFRPDVLRSHLSGFPSPAVNAAKLDYWASEISSGRVDRFGEQEILPSFMEVSLGRPNPPWRTPLHIVRSIVNKPHSTTNCIFLLAFGCAALMMGAIAVNRRT